MHKIGFVVFPNFSLMGFAAITAFETANVALAESAYEVTLLSETGGLVTASAGFKVETQAFDDAVFDTVMFGSGVDTDCAGVLDGRRATAHWRFAPELQRRFPKVIVEDDQMFIVDGSVWTSAGMTATIDLALAMIENDYGAEVSRTVARKLVIYHRRAGGQSQFSALIDLGPKSDRIQKAIDYAGSNLKKALSVEELAGVASLSPRQFSRAFSAETGQSPAKAVELLRVEAARLMLEQGRHSMDVIAHEVGFVDRDRMRRAFLRTVGQPPQTIRHLSRTSRVEAKQAQ